jgi:hypothetical protein
MEMSRHQKETCISLILITYDNLVGQPSGFACYLYHYFCVPLLILTQYMIVGVNTPTNHDDLELVEPVEQK